MCVAHRWLIPCCLTGSSADVWDTAWQRRERFPCRSISKRHQNMENFPEIHILKWFMDKIWANVDNHNVGWVKFDCVSRETKINVQFECSLWQSLWKVDFHFVKEWCESIEVSPMPKSRTKTKIRMCQFLILWQTTNSVCTHSSMHIHKQNTFASRSASAVCAWKLWAVSNSQHKMIQTNLFHVCASVCAGFFYR